MLLRSRNVSAEWHRSRRFGCPGQVTLGVMPVLDIKQFLLETKTSAASLRGEIADHGDWYNTFTFSGGLTTPGTQASDELLATLALPDTLAGLHVLDVRAYDGYFAFHAEALGATRVLAMRPLAGEAQGVGRSHFEFVRRILHSRVEESGASLYDPREVGTFDVCLFLGLLSETPNMLEALTKLRALTTSYAVIETAVGMLEYDEPCSAFYPHAETAGNPTLWWHPNIACVNEMLSRAGFSKPTLMGVSALRRPPAAGSSELRAVWHAHV